MKDLLHLCTHVCALMYFFAFVCSERVTGKQEELQRENEREKNKCVLCVGGKENETGRSKRVCVCVFVFVCVRVLCIIAGMRREGA